MKIFYGNALPRFLEPLQLISEISRISLSLKTEEVSVLLGKYPGYYL
jgi:hypothetical protein